MRISKETLKLRVTTTTHKSTNLYICLQLTAGFRLLRKTVEWSGQWGKHMKAAMFRNSLKEYQKLNHIPATFQIGRKDRMWKNVHRYMTKFGKDEFGFVPRSYVLPQDTKSLKKAWDLPEYRGKPWIVKPVGAASYFTHFYCILCFIVSIYKFSAGCCSREWNLFDKQMESNSQKEVRRCTIVHFQTLSYK